MSNIDAPDDADAGPSSPNLQSKSLNALTAPSGTNQNIKAKSVLVARNIVVNGRRTSVRLEPQMWSAIDDISYREHMPRNHIFTAIANRLAPHQSLSSAVRAFIVTYYRESSTESGHIKAGHGSNRIG